MFPALCQLVSLSVQLFLYLFEAPGAIGGAEQDIKSLAREDAMRSASHVADLAISIWMKLAVN